MKIYCKGKFRTKNVPTYTLIAHTASVQTGKSILPKRAMAILAKCYDVFYAGCSIDREIYFPRTFSTDLLFIR